eukprot:m.49712 g.49712  ORF g.49712 m.49712 type:complete len:409 (-) comp7464_c3_seq1:176-1402(-)
MSETKRIATEETTDVVQRDLRVRTEDVTDTLLENFEEFNLNRLLLKGIHEKMFFKPTPVQEKTIPQALLGTNLIVRAKNGTGKTASFLIPILNSINTKKNAVQAVVLLPSRELSLQTAQVAMELGKYLDVQVVSCVGGMNVRDNILRFNRPVHIVVGTVGRVLDLISRKVIRCDHVTTLVMDEADKLVDRTFIINLEEIISYMPPERQTMLLSATFPHSVKEFTDKYVPNAKFINLMEELTLKGVTQYYVFLEEKSKVKCLNTLMKKLQVIQSIIFCNSSKRVELLAKRIIKMGFSCYYIHSNMDQSDRNKIFEQFREGKCRHLVCTDLFTRGIDVEAVNVVINFDFPSSPETYLHRIGRSGRGGHLGLAVNLVTERDRVAFTMIERALQTTIESIPQVIDRSLYVST